MKTCIQVRRKMIHICTLQSLLQPASVTFIAFVIMPLTLVMALTLSLLSDKHTGLLCQCHSTGLRERKRKRQGKSLLCFHALFYLTSLWCETAQYSGFGAAAFPDQWRLNTLSRSPCSGMVEIQIFHGPEIKSFQYLLNPKENIFFLFFQPVHRYLPGAMRGSTAQIHNACSFKTLSILFRLTQLIPISLPKQGL